MLQGVEPEANRMEAEARKEMIKKNLMDVLKGDTNYNMNMFGS